MPDDLQDSYADDYENRIGFGKNPALILRVPHISTNQAANLLARKISRSASVRSFMLAGSSKAIRFSYR